MSEQNHMLNKDSSLRVEKMEQKLDEIPPQKLDQILGSFEEFKQYLGKRVHLGEKLGLNEEKLAKAAEKAADYLAKNEEPRNSEEKLLQELWKVGDKEHRHHLAHMLVRLVS